jgi:hypothetical protein
MYQGSLARIYFPPFRGRNAQKAAWRELCRIIWHSGSEMIRSNCCFSGFLIS